MKMRLIITSALLVLSMSGFNAAPRDQDFTESQIIAEALESGCSTDSECEGIDDQYNNQPSEE